MMAFELATSVSPFPVRKVISVAAALPPRSLLPRLPALQPANEQHARRARSHQRYAAPGLLVNFMEPPELWVEGEGRLQRRSLKRFKWHGNAPS